MTALDAPFNTGPRGTTGNMAVAGREDWKEHATVLLSGSRQEAIPLRLITDPILEPVDKIVAAVVRSLVAAQSFSGDSPRLPGHEHLARLANVSSTTTVTRALTILRLTRWITRAEGQQRDALGRLGPIPWLIHDEPVELERIVLIDPGYMEFLSGARQHWHQRVAEVANALWSALMEVSAATEVPENRDEDQLEQEYSRAQRHLRYAKRIAGGGPGNDNRHQNLVTEHRHQNLVAVTSNRHQNLVAADKEEELLEKTGTYLRHQNLVPEDQILVPAQRSSSSSSYIKTTTTTHTPARAREKAGGSQLADPGRTDPDAGLKTCMAELAGCTMTANHRHLAAMALSALDPAQRSQVIETLRRRLASAESGDLEALRSPSAYVRELCRRATAGTFQANPGSRSEPTRTGVAAVPATPERLAELEDRRRRAKVSEWLNERATLQRLIESDRLQQRDGWERSVRSYEREIAAGDARMQEMLGSDDKDQEKSHGQC